MNLKRACILNIALNHRQYGGGARGRCGAGDGQGWRGHSPCDEKPAVMASSISAPVAPGGGAAAMRQIVTAATCKNVCGAQEATAAPLIAIAGIDFIKIKVVMPYFKSPSLIPS